MLRPSILLLLVSLISACATAQSDTIYNDDPMQKLPLGMQESSYRIRSARGLPQAIATADGSRLRIEPPNWYSGLQHRTLELMIYGSDVRDLRVSLGTSAGVDILRTSRLSNKNYLFVTLSLAADLQPGTYPLLLHDEQGRLVYTHDYDIQPRPALAFSATPAPLTTVADETSPTDASPLPSAQEDVPSSGVTPQLNQRDLVYLIMPDRFANGDRKNDSVEGMAQQGIHRGKFLFRHGGDLLGIMEHLDYLEDLGVTAIWLNPVLENDQPYESYHGYAVTDHYRIDPRLGTNEQYRQLVRLAAERGIKVIMDVIFNHVGDQHFFIRDLPSEDWIHQWPQFTKTSYRATTIFDPYASQADRKQMLEGWFDHHMPDLNQQQPHLANYLIQNSIWWTLYSGQAGFRIDTYAYPDPAFMAEWNRRMKEEFPDLGIFGETWVHGPGVQSWFVGGQHLSQTMDTHLPGVTDFQLYYAINDALSNDPGWTEGVMRIYYTLAQDHLYQDASKNVIFLDNHDLARLFTVVGEDETKYRSALALLLTMRGIPMIYYGTEFGFTGAGGGFGEGGRVDFPGGWRGDETDLFRPRERTDAQQERFTYLRRLARYRRDHPLMSTGKLTQFIPRDGLYVYYREGTAGQKVVTIFNGHSEPRRFDPLAFIGLVEEGDTIYDLTHDKVVENSGAAVSLSAKEVLIWVVD